MTVLRPSPSSVDAPFITAVTDVLNGHRDDGAGWCAGCLTQYGQLKPAPCDQARWARTVISAATAGAAAATTGLAGEAEAPARPQEATGS